LGLAIATEDAQLHGGLIDVWSVPGEGSCFRVTLPRRRGSSVAHSPIDLPPIDPQPIDVLPIDHVAGERDA
jgi:two-component system sensor histidine kinase MtrB